MGESSNSGTCQVESCPKYGQPLAECECEDGRHPIQLDAKQAIEKDERETIE